MNVEILQGCGCCRQTTQTWPLKDKASSHIYSHKIIHVILKYERKGFINDHASWQSALRDVEMMILTCSSSLTLSIGATAVLEIAAATPPAKKSLAKESAASPMMIILKLSVL